MQSMTAKTDSYKIALRDLYRLQQERKAAR